MATAKKTTAKKTTTRKTATTRSTTKTAPAAKAQAAAQDVKVDVKAIATDTAYATVGVADRAVEVSRELPAKLEELRKARAEQAATFVKEAPVKAQTFVKDVPTKLQAELAKDLEAAKKELDGFAARGRKVVDSITKAPSTKKALSQTETARSQVKGAVTSIRKAVEQGQDAVEGAVERIGVRRSA